MLPITLFREQPEIVKASEKKRGKDPAVVDEILNYDKKWRAGLKKFEVLKHQRNVVSQEINQAKKKKDEKTAKQKIKSMQDVVAQIKKQETVVQKSLEKRDSLIEQVGNILHSSVPVGKDDSENVEIRKFGKVPEFKFPIKDHIELGESLDLFEFDVAAKNSGSRFYYLNILLVVIS